LRECSVAFDVEGRAQQSGIGSERAIFARRGAAHRERWYKLLARLRKRGTQRSGERCRCEQVGDFSFGRDFGGVFSAPSHNVFLVKLSYWLNM